MSDKNKKDEDDESAILLDDLNDDNHQKQNIHINADDEEMLLLSSSPSPPSSPLDIDKKKTTSSSDAGPSCEKKTPSTGNDLNTSTSNIVIEDSSDSAEVCLDDSNSNSVEVIGSDDDEEELEEESDSDESLAAYLDGKVEIYMAQGSFFIWNADDVNMLREECRIVGKLVGCLPRAPRQNNQLGLPLQLMPEEAKLLEEIEAACVVEEVDTVPDDIVALRESTFKVMREDNYEVQKKMYKESRKEEIQQHKSVILEGKRAKKRKIQELQSKKKSESSKISKSEDQEKSLENLELDSSDSEMREKSSEVHGNDDENKTGDGESISKTSEKLLRSKVEETESNSENKDDCVIIAGDDSMMGNGNEGSEDDDDDDFNVDDIVTEETNVKHSLIQLFTENPWKENVKRPKHWIFPLSQKEFLRYEVFRDLWKKGYFLTSGSKFGGDFLVYPAHFYQYKRNQPLVSGKSRQIKQPIKNALTGKIRDPARFHSHFIAVCIDKTVDLSALDIVSLGRLGSNVRKTVLLCAFSKSRQIIYTSLQWTGIR